ncbi:MAG: hypothetical protein WCE51_07305 [Chthoniobacterales bacterium]|jgi:hypothetical protein
MHNQTHYYRKTLPALIALVLLCFGLTPATQAAGRRSIVGLWNVHYFVGTAQIFETYDQWHSDGLEFEVNSIAPGAVCQGTFKQMDNGTVQLYHVIYTYDASGVFNGRILETQTNTVSADGKTYGGSFDQKVYDLNGNFLSEVTGTVTATRITVRG